MDRFLELLETGRRASDTYLWILSRTIWVVIYGPAVVLVFGVLFSAVPIYFVTLFRTPSWIHLYIGVVFVGVTTYRVWFWRASNLDFKIARGRKVDREPPAETLEPRARPRTSRVDRIRTTIRRGR